MIELEQCRAEVARLRTGNLRLWMALRPLLDEIGSGSDLDYHLRVDGHAERLQAALSTPADDWKCPGCEQLRKRHAALRDALADIAQASCCLSPGCDVDDPHCDAMMAEAALHYDESADDWLAAHDAEVRQKERERIIADAQTHCQAYNERCIAAIREQGAE